MKEYTGSEIILRFLGTGSAIPPTKRQQVSFALIHPHGTILFDCGEGTQYRIRKHHVPMKKDLVIAISHIHSDHTLGLPGLLSSFELQGRSEKITIIGPQGTLKFLKNVMYAFYVSVSFEINVIELRENEYHRGKNYTLYTHKALHDAPGGSFSYVWQEDEGKNKFDTVKLDTMGIPRGPHLKKLQLGQPIEINGMIVKPEDVMFKGRRGRVIAYSGDTSPNPKFIKSLPNHVDILVHEASYPIEMEQVAEERGHCTIKQAVQVAKLGSVDRLLLTHITPRFTYAQLKQEFNIVKQIFNDTIITSDGDEYILPLPDYNKEIPID